jgi:hypothetical protein
VYLQGDDVRSHDDFVRKELENPLLLDPELSMFGEGSTRAAFDQGEHLYIISRSDNAGVREMLLSLKDFQDNFAAKLKVSARPELQVSTRVRESIAREYTCNAHVECA